MADKHLFVVLSEPVPGQDDEYNRWYNEQHLDDVLKVPGVVSAQRFKLTMDGAKALPAKYLALYELETDDPKATFAAMGKAAQAGQMPSSPAMNNTNVVASVFTPITERKLRKK